jgi:hypothetical protein
MAEQAPVLPQPSRLIPAPLWRPQASALKPEHQNALLSVLTVNSVTTVQEFQQLVRCMEDKGALQSTVREGQHEGRRRGWRGARRRGLPRSLAARWAAGRREPGLPAQQRWDDRGRSRRQRWDDRGRSRRQRWDDRGRSRRQLAPPARRRGASHVAKVLSDPVEPAPAPRMASHRPLRPTPSPPSRPAPARPQLINVLKLNKEKWEEARDHALMAVLPDRRMRAWYENMRCAGKGASAQSAARWREAVRVGTKPLRARATQRAAAR